MTHLECFMQLKSAEFVVVVFFSVVSIDLSMCVDQYICHRCLSRLFLDIFRCVNFV